MPITPGLYSSKSDKWDTPQELLDNLALSFDWDMDVCASRPNVCENYYAPQDDGLAKPWSGLCWMNPPYGRAIGLWMAKAKRSAMVQVGASVVCLVPARTDTVWWHDNIHAASQVVFIRGRLTFGSDAYWRSRWDDPTDRLYGKVGKTNSAPFPSAFVVFGEIKLGHKLLLATHGWNISQPQQAVAGGY